jgi:hypothetical protein
VPARYPLHLPSLWPDAKWLAMLVALLCVLMNVGHEAHMQQLEMQAYF